MLVQAQITLPVCITSYVGLYYSMKSPELLQACVTREEIEYSNTPRVMCDGYIHIPQRCESYDHL